MEVYEDHKDNCNNLISGVVWCNKLLQRLMYTLQTERYDIYEPKEIKHLQARIGHIRSELDEVLLEEEQFRNKEKS